MFNIIVIAGLAMCASCAETQSSISRRDRPASIEYWFVNVGEVSEVPFHCGLELKVIETDADSGRTLLELWSERDSKTRYRGWVANGQQVPFAAPLCDPKELMLKKTFKDFVQLFTQRRMPREI